MFWKPFDGFRADVTSIVLEFTSLKEKGRKSQARLWIKVFSFPIIFSVLTNNGKPVREVINKYTCPMMRTPRRELMYPGVDFTNSLQAAFFNTSLLNAAFSILAVLFVYFRWNDIGKKAPSKMLVKLTYRCWFPQQFVLNFYTKKQSFFGGQSAFGTIALNYDNPWKQNKLNNAVKCWHKCWCYYGGLVIMLEPIFATGPVTSKKTTCFKSG